MARLPRLSIAGCPHHVLQRGNNRQPVFMDDADRVRYLALLGEAASRFKVAVHAYVLLDNHAHLLLTPSDAAGLTQTMQALGHDRYQVVGHDIGMWIAYALASDQPDAVQRLAITEAVIPGLAEAPPVFVAPEDNIFLWHFMFNQVRDLPEALIAGRERAYLTFMFDRWAHRREAVACEVYIRAYAAPGGSVTTFFAAE